jgi:hypothetical protein
MQTKDKQFLANVFKRVSASVTTVNAKIVAHQQGKISAADVQATTGLEQLGMQHEMLILLAMLVYDPGTGTEATEAMPEWPKKMIGFS